MYKLGYVLAIKDNNKRVLRENNSVVRLPFYEEYSLHLKNDNDKRAVAKVFIDGEDVLDGKQIIIPANGSVDLERYLEGSNDRGRRFQFVPTSDSRVKDKKNSADIGIIEVIFQKEKKRPAMVLKCSGFSYSGGTHTKPSAYYYNYSHPISSTNTSMSFKAGGQSSSRAASLGGTAKGSRSTQGFSDRSVGELEDETVTLRLRILADENPNTPIKQDKNAKFCINCGTKNKYVANFCYKCGNKMSE